LKKELVMHAAFDVLKTLGLKPQMEFDPAEDEIHLQGNQMLRLRNSLGLVVRVVSGSLWITQDGDTRDIVLEAGQSFEPDRNGVVLLSPIGTAAILLKRRHDLHAAQDFSRSVKPAPPLSVELTV
jgi:hypothetical protein